MPTETVGGYNFLQFFFLQKLQVVVNEVYEALRGTRKESSSGSPFDGSEFVEKLRPENLRLQSRRNVRFLVSKFSQKFPLREKKMEQPKIIERLDLFLWLAWFTNFQRGLG